MLASMKGDVPKSNHGERSIAEGWTWIEGALEILSGLLEFGLDLLL